MGNVRLSILTPVYNVKDELAKMIESVLAQSFTEFELILSDDGSTDGSAEICDRYAKKDSRVVALHFENGGVSEARNRAVAAAKGEYIGFVDSDDVIENNMFERLMSTAYEYDADIVQCKHNRDASVCGGSGEVRVMTGADMLDEMLCRAQGGDYTNIVALWSKVYKAEILKSIVFPKDRTYEDEAKMPEILLKAKKLVQIDEILYHYIYRPVSIIGHSTFRKQCDKLQALRERIDYIKTVDEKYYPDAVIAYYNYHKIFMLENTKYPEEECEGYNKKLVENLLKDKKLIKKFVNKYEKINIFLMSLKNRSILKWLIGHQFEPIQDFYRKLKK